MNIDAFGCTHKGNVRGHNEDNIYVDGVYRSDLSKDNIVIASNRTRGPFTYGVFDGMGGESNGERASLVVAKYLKETEDRDGFIEVENFIKEANRAIHREAEEIDAYNMGTTAAVVYIYEGAATAFNIGDSRIYIYRNGELKQVSRDHSVEQSMIDCGFIDESERYKSNHAGELTQYIGMPDCEEVELVADKFVTELRVDDILLLCTDGLTSELSNDAIQLILSEHKDEGSKSITRGLIEKALGTVCKDNVSIIVCKII